MNYQLATPQSASITDITSLIESVAHLNERINRLESATPVAPPATHPSLDKFAVAEAIADSIFAGVKSEKACQFEPDKPCDHCSMCNSRGF